jgi:hypothetical protein
MGTLFDQQPRQESISSYVHTVRRVAAEMDYDLNTIKPAEWHAACDVVRTALALQTADTLDEQLAGFGEILKELVAAIGELGGREHG